ncbi:Pkinase-fungal domain-containing protein [Pseudohyphozyma bogoriensis]|nr:Pkinase-fungal domain-containing protein [Pseudohyphozyma bogoriensis]
MDAPSRRVLSISATSPESDDAPSTSDAAPAPASEIPPALTSDPQALQNPAILHQTSVSESTTFDSPSKPRSQSLRIDERRDRDKASLKEFVSGKIVKMKLQDLLSGVGGQDWSLSVESRARALLERGGVTDRRVEQLKASFEDEARVRAKAKEEGSNARMDKKKAGKAKEKSKEGAARKGKAKATAEEEEEEDLVAGEMVESPLAELTWLMEFAQIAENATPVDTEPRRLFLSAPTKPLTKGTTVEHKRKPDAMLAISRKNVWTSVMVPIEFTTTDVASEIRREINFWDKKVVQQVMNMADLWKEQPWRLFTLGLGFFDGIFVVFVLDRECLRVAEIHDCWTQKGVAHVAALLEALRLASLDVLGFNPLFGYTLELLPSTFYLSILKPTLRDVEIRDPRSFATPSPPTSRGTLVFAGYIVGDGGNEGLVIIKFHFPDERRRGREPAYLEDLNKAKPDDPKLHVPTLVYGCSFERLSFQLSGKHEDEYRKAPQTNFKLKNLTHRNLELLVTSTPVPLASVLPAQFTPAPLRVFGGTVDQLFGGLASLIETLVGAHERGILHRDPSVYNILLALMNDIAIGFGIDWECATDLVQLESASNVSAKKLARTGTRQYMALEILDRTATHHRLRHDLESVYYVVWAVVLATVVDGLEKQAAAAGRLEKGAMQAEALKWKGYLNTFGFFTSNLSDDVIIAQRDSIWSLRTGAPGHVMRELIATDDRKPMANLLSKLTILKDSGLGPQPVGSENPADVDPKAYELAEQMAALLRKDELGASKNTWFNQLYDFSRRE